MDALHEHIRAELVLGRYGEDLRIGKQAVPLLHEVAELRLVTLVNLVDQEDYRYRHLRDLLQKVHVLLRILDDIRHIKQDIGIGQGRLGELEHHLLHLVVRLQHARRVREDDLSILRIDDTHDTVARCLCLESGNAELLTDELVHQCALSDIRIADDVYESCFVHNLF